MAKTEVSVPAAVAINTGELQRFSEVWAPVINALPAIINAVGHKDELQRHIGILSAQRDAVVAETAKAKADLDKRIESAREALRQLEKERLAEIEAVKVAKREAAEQIKVFEVSVKAAEDRATAQIALHNFTVDDAESLKKTRIKEVEDSVNALRAEKMAELESIEKRVSSAQGSLDRLRAKLEG